MSSRVLHSPFSRSVFIHGLLFLLLFILSNTLPRYVPQEPITIDVIQPPQAKNKGRDKSVVQKSAGLETKDAKENSYLSDKTRTVREERSASRPGENEGTRSTPIQIVRPTQQGQEKRIEVSDLGMKLAPRETKKTYEQDRNWANAETGEAMRGGQYIQGMKEGAVSALNTKEFVFFSYFDRVRRQLDQAWQPMLREQIQKIYKAGRKLASNTDYVTRTLVTLNEKGDVLRVQILEESGTFDLDQAAIGALNKAGPYPNPPKGLIDEAGQVQIRWDFILKV